MSTDQTPIALPVTAVTCLEDRAHVERSAELELQAGVQRLRLGPVSALAVDRTLHAELTADHPASVLDLRIVRSWTPRGPLPDADDSALRHRLHSLEKEQAALKQRRDRLRARLDALARLAADLLRDIGEGAGSGETDVPRWSRELDRVDGERDTCSEELRSIESELAAVAAELDSVRRAMDLAETEPVELVGHIELTVQAAAAGSVGLRLSHLTPCALWRPAYRAVLDGGALTLETDAMVWQQTGEDWSDVRLTLSTARSGGGGGAPPAGGGGGALAEPPAAGPPTGAVGKRAQHIG
ncbi:mucoidy inhibitor MuiA family protein, partial [Streptomyces sp. NPDC059766]|uniref:mucoidy inhibitor MuiA family protein n=1 Tax=Streptomyces sp. NPDC059766 TaxID=3346940 RepID=UPI00364A001A